MVSTVLLCPPNYYQIEYVINPWMHLTNKVDTNRAMEEFDWVVEIYKRIGLEVLIIPQVQGLPDMTYAANLGFVIDNTFIKSNLKFPQRRKEADFAEEFFRNKSTTGSTSITSTTARKFKIKTLPSDVYFEGQGDMFYKDGKFFMGYGKRSSKEASHYIREIIGEEPITFEVNDPYFYHLDTCFAPLGNGRVVINPRSFNKQDLSKLKKTFKKVIVTSEQDNKLLCCNLVAANGAIVIGQGISKDFRSTLKKEGYEVFETPMNEFLKGGGSVKCLTLELFNS